MPYRFKSFSFFLAMIVSMNISVFGDAWSRKIKHPVYKPDTDVAETAVAQYMSMPETDLKAQITKDGGKGINVTMKQAAYDMARLYQKTRKQEYADKAVLLLERFAEVVPQWPMIDRSNGKPIPLNTVDWGDWNNSGLWGIWFHQDLEQCVEIPLAYDFIASNGAHTAGGIIPSEARTIIDEIWKSKKVKYAESIKADFAKGKWRSFALYNTQLFTNNLLVYAFASKDYKLINEMLELYLTAYDCLEQKDDYTYLCMPGKELETVLPLKPAQKMWLDHTERKNAWESILASSQFLYLLTYAVEKIRDIRQINRSEVMNKFLKCYEPIIREHYERWVFAQQGMFQVRGWGCTEGLFNHYDFMAKKYNKEFKNLGDKKTEYCNAITDDDMWILAGVVEMLAAEKKSPGLFGLNGDKKKRFLGYVKLGTKCLLSRLSKSDLTDFNGKKVTGLNFDLGMWDNYSDNAYSGYDGEKFPATADKKTAPGTGWDISHARRFVQVFNTLYDNRNITGQPMVDRKIMEGLANQIIYGAFNKDFKRPLFTNYMDGTNGWYRVGYHGPTFGYPPYGLADSFLSGGYGFWSRFNPDIKKVLLNIRELILEANKANSDPNLKEFTKKYYSGYFKNDTDLLLMFLPALMSTP